MVYWVMNDGNCDLSEDRRVDGYDTDPETTPFAIEDENLLPMLSIHSQPTFQLSVKTF